MSGPGRIEDTIMLPGQDHSWRRKGQDLDYRTIPLYVRIVGRADTLYEGLGHYELDPNAHGDLTCMVAWPTAGEGKRPFAAWSPCFPSIVVAPAPEADSADQTSVPGQRDGELLLPAYDSEWQIDERLKPIQVAAGGEAGDVETYPRGTRGILLGAVREDEQHEVFVCGDRRLVAVNRPAARSDLSSRVYDLTPEDAYDPDRWAYLHSAWRVARPYPGLVPWDARYGALAWQLGRSGPSLGLPGNIPGYGICADAPRVLRPPPPPPPPVGATSIVLASPTGGTSTVPDSTVLYGAAGVAAGGPLSCGLEPDQHEIGLDWNDGIHYRRINAVHLDTGSLWLGHGGDAPLHFEGPYPHPPSAPNIAPVHLGHDALAQHDFLGELRQGMWRWWAEVPIFVPPPEQPPEKPPPNIPNKEIPPDIPDKKIPPPRRDRDINRPPGGSKSLFTIGAGEAQAAFVNRKGGNAVIKGVNAVGGAIGKAAGAAAGAAAGGGAADRADRDRRRNRRRSWIWGVLGVKKKDVTGFGGEKVDGSGLVNDKTGPGANNAQNGFGGTRNPDGSPAEVHLGVNGTGNVKSGSGLTNDQTGPGANNRQSTWGGARNANGTPVKVNSGAIIRYPSVAPDPPDDTSPAGNAPPRRRDVSDAKEPVAQTTLPIAAPAVIFRPAYVDLSGIDIRKRRTPAPAAQATYVRDAPMTARVEGFVRETDAGRVPAYTVNPCSDRYGGGTAPGGLVVMPPELDVLDAFAGATTSERGTAVSATALVLYQTSLAWGTPQRTGSAPVSSTGWTAALSGSNLNFATSGGGSFTVNGSPVGGTTWQARTITSSPATVAADDRILICDTDTIGGNLTLNVLGQAGTEGQIVLIRNIGTSGFTVNYTASTTILGTSAKSLTDGQVGQVGCTDPVGTWYHLSPTV